MNPFIESFTVVTHLYLEPLLTYNASKVNPAEKMPGLMCATGQTRPEEGFLVLRRNRQCLGLSTPTPLKTTAGDMVDASF